MKVHIVKLENDIDEELFNEFLKYVSDKKAEKILRYRHKKDQLRSLIGDVLIRNILCDELSINNENLEFATNSYGKPYLKNYNKNFNISHSGDYVVGVVDSDLVGIDIEEIKPMDDMFDIAKSFFTETENKWLESLHEDKKVLGFYKIWTAKESYLKLLGVGLSKKTNSFSVVIEDNNKIHIKDKNTSNNYYCSQIILGNKYCLTVCSQKKLDFIDFVTSSLLDKKMKSSKL